LLSCFKKIDEAVDGFNKRKDEESKRCRAVNDIKEQIGAMQNDLANISNQTDLQVRN
jgi:hypothetical protein